MKSLKGESLLTFIVNTAIILIILFVGTVSLAGGGVKPITGGQFEAIDHGDRSGNNVAIMVNVYENTANVRKILAILERHGAKATFFVGGCWADDNTECLKEIVGGGHELANHGYFHKDHKKLSLEKNKEEIELTERICYALTGVKTELFAPPSGAYNTTTLKAAAELNYKVIMWSKDTIDWRDDDDDKVFRRATEGVSGGDLILMHPKDVTVRTLEKILEYYEKSGLKAATVTQTIA